MYFTNACSQNVTSDDILYLYRISSILQECSEAVVEFAKKNPNYNIQVDCHTLCRFLKIGLPELRVASGNYFGLVIGADDGRRLKGCEHSWLVTPDGAIVDPYPVGFLCVESAVLVPTKGEYKDYASTYYYEEKGLGLKLYSSKLWRNVQMLLRAYRHNMPKTAPD